MVETQENARQSEQKIKLSKKSDSFMVNVGATEVNLKIAIPYERES